MQKLIADIRAAAHKERQINREATELQMLALEFCAEVEKRYLMSNDPLIKLLNNIFIDPEPMKDESHSIARYI